MADDDTFLDEIIALSLAYDHFPQHGSSPNPFMNPSSSSSSSSPPLLSCDLCHAQRTVDHCYLDMEGCSHVLCLHCLYSATSTSCPIPSCRKGSILAGPPSSPPPHCEIECKICMETKNPSEGFFDIKGCDHVFCSGCIAQYVAAKVEENATSIPCPDPSCSAGSLELDSCRAILPHEVFVRWGISLCEGSIDGSVRFYCPYKDCSVLMVVEEGEVLGEGGEVCPHCERRVCGRCKVPWHDGFGCEEYQKLGDGEREKEDLMLMKMAKRSRWQRCPKCGYFVERLEGCVFIVCRCKHCFCYVCAAQMDAKDSRHYCSKCKLTWDKKK